MNEGDDPFKFATRLILAAVVALVLLLLAAVVALGLLVGGAWAHDIYNGVRDHRGILCCGGDPVTGDCEKLEAEQIVMSRDGSARMFSKRYGAWITVGRDLILPTAIPGDGGAAGHFCGMPRQKVGRMTEPLSDDQPDPKFVTYCAFVAPGGV